MSDETQYCTFHLGNYYFGIDVAKVQEVLRYQEMTSVPLASNVVRGLINLRGEIVTAIDLRERLELSPRSGDELPMNVVVRDDDGGAVAFLVDDIGDVLEIDPQSFEPPPATLKGVARELVQGVCKLEDRLLLILNTEKAVEIPADRAA